MLRHINFFGYITLTVFSLASYSLAQGSSLPDTAYEFDRGDLFDGALYISNFECLAYGEYWPKQQACIYYKALVSEGQTPDKTSKEICFKETQTVGKPRDFKSENALRIKYETASNKSDFTGSYLEGAISAAHIISNERINKTVPQSKWYETTLVALYDCDSPLNESATKSKTSPKTPTASEQDFLKNPPLAEDQTLPHGLQLLPGHAVITNPEQSETHEPNQNFVVKVPSTSGHDSWWAEQYAQQLKNFGWTATNIPSLHILNRVDGQCNEQMILISLDPNSQNSPMFKNSNMPEIEYSAVVFNYSNSGECSAND